MKRKILIVDDEASITRMIKLNLERTERFEVRTENKGRQAISAAREFKPDLIFLDVMMPDMPGDEVAAELKEDAELKAIKVAFLTAIVTQDETSGGSNTIGGNLFLAKPAKMDDILQAIDTLLGEEVGASEEGSA